MNTEALWAELWGIGIFTAAVVGLVWAISIWRRGKP